MVARDLLACRALHSPVDAAQAATCAVATGGCSPRTLPCLSVSPFPRSFSSLFAHFYGSITPPPSCFHRLSSFSALGSTAASGSSNPLPSPPLLGGAPRSRAGQHAAAGTVGPPFQRRQRASARRSAAPAQGAALVCDYGGHPVRRRVGRGVFGGRGGCSRWTRDGVCCRRREGCWRPCAHRLFVSRKGQYRWWRRQRKRQWWQWRQQRRQWWRRRGRAGGRAGHPPAKGVGRVCRTSAFHCAAVYGIGAVGRVAAGSASGQP